MEVDYGKKMGLQRIHERMRFKVSEVRGTNIDGIAQVFQLGEAKGEQTANPCVTTQIQQATPTSADDDNKWLGGRADAPIDAAQ